jgi:hypothetical protein
MECGLSSPPVTVHFLKSAARDPQVLMLMLRTGAGQHDEAGQPGSCMIHMREVMQPGCMIAWGRVCRGNTQADRSCGAAYPYSRVSACVIVRVMLPLL